jgi:hypothetical protein
MHTNMHANMHANAAGTYLELIRAARGAGEARGKEKWRSQPQNTLQERWVKSDARRARATPATVRATRKHALESAQYIPRADASDARRGRGERQRIRSCKDCVSSPFAMRLPQSVPRPLRRGSFTAVLLAGYWGVTGDPPLLPGYFPVTEKQPFSRPYVWA